MLESINPRYVEEQKIFYFDKSNSPVIEFSRCRMMEDYLVSGRLWFEQFTWEAASALAEKERGRLYLGEQDRMVQGQNSYTRSDDDRRVFLKARGEAAECPGIARLPVEAGCLTGRRLDEYSGIPWPPSADSTDKQP